MKYLIILAILSLVSCVNKAKDWDFTEPVESSMKTEDKVQSRAYSAHVTGLENKAENNSEAGE